MQFRAETTNTPGAKMHCFRSSEGQEVDLIITRGRRLYAIEVTAQADPQRSKKAAHLTRLRDALGDAFTGGILLYAGHQEAKISDRIIAAPISALWPG
jgi:uncharacterized protein